MVRPEISTALASSTSMHVHTICHHFAWLVETLNGRTKACVPGCRSGMVGTEAGSNDIVSSLSSQPIRA